MKEQEQTALWRVGKSVPINVYEGNRPICQCHYTLDAKRIVDAVNLWAVHHEIIRKLELEVERLRNTTRQ